MILQELGHLLVCQMVLQLMVHRLLRSHHQSHRDLNQSHRQYPLQFVNQVSTVSGSYLVRLLLHHGEHVDRVRMRSLALQPGAVRPGKYVDLRVIDQIQDLLEVLDRLAVPEVNVRVDYLLRLPLDLFHGLAPLPRLLVDGSDVCPPQPKT